MVCIISSTGIVGTLPAFEVSCKILHIVFAYSKNPKEKALEKMLGEKTKLPNHMNKAKESAISHVMQLFEEP
jgi:hypothetical protein